jgi:hypothetical protein
LIFQVSLRLEGGAVDLDERQQPVVNGDPVREALAALGRLPARERLLVFAVLVRAVARSVGGRVALDRLVDRVLAAPSRQEGVS